MPTELALIAEMRSESQRLDTALRNATQFKSEKRYAISILVADEVARNLIRLKNQLQYAVKKDLDHMHQLVSQEIDHLMREERPFNCSVKKDARLGKIILSVSKTINMIPRSSKLFFTEIGGEIVYAAENPGNFIKDYLPLLQETFDKFAKQVELDQFNR